MVMTRRQSSQGVLPAPLLASLAGVAFCVWSAWGNGLNLCVTHGCTLYQDASIGGISLWWSGAGAFAVMALIALMGRPGYGLFASGLCLVLDIALLALMAVTAPCVGCLLVAVLFALCYVAFRYAHGGVGRLSRSWLLWVWVCLMCVNVGAVVKSEMGPWRMFGPDDDEVRLYFSPSCAACREAVMALGGRVNVGFYPVVEEYADVPRVAAMRAALDKGRNMAEALTMAQQPLPKQGALDVLAPDSLLLWLRLTRNKAHVLNSGSLSVPFIEFQGLPTSLVAPRRPMGVAPTPAPAPTGQGPLAAPSANTDPSLPIDTGISASCGKPGARPCPDDFLAAPQSPLTPRAPDGREPQGTAPATYGPMRDATGGDLSPMSPLTPASRRTPAPLARPGEQ